MYPGILGLCMYEGAKNQAPADAVTTLASNGVISNRFFLSLCRTYMMNWANPMATGPGGILVLGAGEDLTCSGCQLNTSNYSFVKYRDTTVDCAYSYYSITIVDFAVKDIPLNLSPTFAPGNSFSFAYLGKTYDAGFSTGCPRGSLFPNILDSGTSQILLPGPALQAIGAAICHAYTGQEPNCVGMFSGRGYWFKTLDGLPDVSILLWDDVSSSIVTLRLPPTAYADHGPSHSACFVFKLSAKQNVFELSKLCRSYTQTYFITSSDKSFAPYVGPAYFSNFGAAISTGNTILGHPVFTSYGAPQRHEHSSALFFFLIF